MSILDFRLPNSIHPRRLGGSSFFSHFSPHFLSRPTPAPPDDPRSQSSRQEHAAIPSANTSPDTLPSSPLPPRAPSQSESTPPSRFPGTSAPSSSIPVGFPPVPARTERCGIGWAWPHGLSSRHPARTGTWNCAAFASAYGFECGRRTGVQMPPRSPHA